MAKYESPAVTLPAPAEKVYEKLSNLGNLKSVLDRIPAHKIPEDKRDIFEAVEITDNSISLPAGPVGNLTFHVVEKVEPTLIRLKGEGAPVAMALALHIRPGIDNHCEAKAEVDVDIPAMLKPMVGGHIQKLADQFGQVLQAIDFA